MGFENQRRMDEEQMNKNMRELLKFLKRHGYTVTSIMYKGKHPKLYINNSNDGIAVSKTPSSKGSYKKILADVRRRDV